MNETRSTKELSWNQYITLVNKLNYAIISCLKKNNIGIHFIYAIQRGGMIPGTILAHELGINIVRNDFNEAYKIIAGNILIIDDISDTGRTLSEHVNKFVNNKDIKILTATLHLNERSIFIPDFHVIKVAKNIYIKYPYEKESDKLYSNSQM
jgi:hypoxanthine phosphoribosyltransferase